MIVLEATVAADLTSVSHLRRTLRSVLRSRGVADSVSNDLQLVVAELAANVANHSRPRATRIELHVEFRESAIVVSISDDGGPFVDFAARLTHADTSEPHIFAESGRGLGLVRGLCTDLVYEAGPPNMMIAVYETEHSPDTAP